MVYMGLPHEVMFWDVIFPQKSLGPGSKRCTPKHQDHGPDYLACHIVFFQGSVDVWSVSKWKNGHHILFTLGLSKVDECHIGSVTMSPGLFPNVEAVARNAPSCSVNLLWVCLKISVLGIGVCKRKYADMPLRRSLCLRQNAVTPIALFPLIRRYANRCVYGAPSPTLNHPETNPKLTLTKP
jgi:hypothetical protein